MADTKEQFYSDLSIAKKTELEVAELLKVKFGLSEIKMNNDYKYDFVGLQKGKEFSFEVKEDFTCAQTGNIGIEYSCRGRDSGIARSKADFYVIKAHLKSGFEIILIPSKTLKELISNNKFFRTVQGGSRESKSFNYLFKREVLEKAGKIIHRA